MRYGLLFFACFVIFLPLSVAAQDEPDELDVAVEAKLATMSDAQRVAQLMVVSFEGVVLEPDSKIVSLLEQYQLGGVMLSAAHDNIHFTGQVQALTNQLQELNATAATARDESFMPLLIGTRHQGNGLPGTEITIGTTPLPSYLSLGATWNLQHARRTGLIAGEELAAVGVNMLLEPSLNMPILDSGASWLAEDTFGSQPQWVGQMASAYVTGLQQGANGRVLVMGGQLPGLGAIDRDLHVEVPTIPRDIAALRRYELLPFYAVAPAVDGLQCANVLYQGAVRPTCLDVDALNNLLTDFGDWRGDHLLVSDYLGTRAIEQWYDAEQFFHRRATREALLAGNDLLLMVDVDAEYFTEDVIIDTLDFFLRGYRSDEFFKARVDEAVTRIVRAKLSLYGTDYDLNAVLVDDEALVGVGEQIDPLYRMARDAVTLISPPLEQLPSPPDVDDQMLIFTELDSIQQCSTCGSLLQIRENALENAMMDLYGAESTGQIQPENLHSYALDDLRNFDERDEILVNDLQAADWVVFVVLDDMATVSSFLENRDGVIPSDARVLVLAMQTPYGFSATDISRMSAFIGLFSDIQPFVDAAARAVMQDVAFAGRLPVSLPQINYDVAQATQPDPDSPLTLTTLIEDPTGNIENAFSAEIGETLLVRTAEIRDANGKVVVDGTPVEFTLRYVAAGLQIPHIAYTEQGMAATRFIPTQAGQIEIVARSGAAVTDAAFQMIVRRGDEPVGTLVAVQNPTPTLPPDTPFVTRSPTPDITATVEAIRNPPSSGTPTFVPEDRSYVSMSDLMLTLMGLGLLIIPAFAAGWATLRSLDASLRVVLGMVVAGLTAYVYYGIGAPGAGILRSNLGDLAAMVISFVSGIMGLLFTWWTVRFISHTLTGGLDEN